jgi:LysM repeat protein
MGMSNNRWTQTLLAASLLLSGMAAAPPRQGETPTPAPPPTVQSTATTTATAFDPFAWVSPTPDETGAIVVIVQPGDSLWVIAARAGLTLPELLALNPLAASQVINPGDALIVGYVTPQPTLPAATATPPPPTPRPTEAPLVASVCLSAYDDLDQDGLHDADEPLRGGVAFTIYNTEAVVANYITDGLSEPKCVGGLPPGEYRVTRSVIPGELLTSAGDWSLNLTAGSELHQAFGSVAGAARTASPANTPTQPAQPTATPPSAVPLTTNSLVPRLAGVIALFTGGLLLLGAVLILLVRGARRPAAQPPDSTGGERRFRSIDDVE